MLPDYSDTLRTGKPRRKLEVKICAVHLKYPSKHKPDSQSGHQKMEFFLTSRLEEKNHLWILPFS
jgi:hypothetical protein